jgi:hypothetical protein
MDKKGLKRIVFLFLFLLLPFIARAQIEEFAKNIFTKVENFLYDLGYVVTLVFMIIGGYQILTSAGDPNKFEQGKRTLIYAAIGFLVVLVARHIVDWIKIELGPPGAPTGTVTY